MAERVDLSTLLPPPDLAKMSAELRRLYEDRAIPVPTRWRVFGTRNLARVIVAELPAGPVVLDCSEVSVLTTPFIHELLTLRPDIEPDGLNLDCAASWAIAAPGYQGQPGEDAGGDACPR